MNTTVVVLGANGFLGRYLCRHYARSGYEVVAIARSRKGWSGDGMFLEWDGKSVGPWSYALEGAGMVINLAGRSVDCRYNAKNRREIIESRVQSTEAVGRAIAECKVPPKLWLNASTATWYRHAEDKPQDEWDGEAGSGFSHDVAQAWEDAFFSAHVPAETRKVALRIGMVLANESGTVYDVLTKLANRGLGGAMGDGRQRVSWVHMEDFLRAVEWIRGDSFCDGIVNITAPDFPMNRELMRGFRDLTQKSLGLPAKRWMVEFGAILLRTEAELVLKSRWAEPKRLRDAGFRWHYAKINDAISDLKGRVGLEGFFAGSNEAWVEEGALAQAQVGAGSVK